MAIGLNEQDYLNKEFKKCGIIYNQLVSATTKMWHQLRKTRKYRELMADIAKAAPDSDEQKALFKQREKKPRNLTIQTKAIPRRNYPSEWLVSAVAI